MIEKESTENCSMSDSSSPYWITAPKVSSDDGVDDDADDDADDDGDVDGGQRKLN
jgi:hypothetical protein